jgi:hypothetical protein
MATPMPESTLLPSLIPFFIKLKKVHRLDMLTSYTAKELQESPDSQLRKLAAGVQVLQLLTLAGDTEGYSKKLLELNTELHHEGIGFRNTKGIIYLTKYEGKKVDVEVALQVKGHSLTWYFWAEGAMDQYPQGFRDLLYNKAAICHKSVKDGCDLYYRGSNSVHVKRMHHDERESGHNHNHYRLLGSRHYTPEDVRQHMSGFKDWDMHDLFFEAGEIDSICAFFNEHYIDWTTKHADLPATKEELYFSHPSQQLNVGDMIELHLFGAMQEPCRLSVDELKIDYDIAREEIEATIKAYETSLVKPADEPPAITILRSRLIKLGMEYEELLTYRQVGGIRGLNSSIASARQIEHSENPIVRARQTLDDSIGKEVPAIPEWASKLREAADVAHQDLLRAAAARLGVRKLTDSDVAREWLTLAEPAKRGKVEALLYDLLESESESEDSLITGMGGTGAAAGGAGGGATVASAAPPLVKAGVGFFAKKVETEELVGKVNVGIIPPPRRR